MSKTVIQFEFNSPAEAAGFLGKLSGPAPIATNPMTGVAMNPAAPNPAMQFGATLPQTQQQNPAQFNPQQTQFNPQLTQPVAPANFMPAIIQKATDLCNAGRQNEVGQIVQSEFGLAKLTDCPPAVQQNLLNRLSQLG